ncbi:MAG: PDDEXK nuclease domain-containing protein [Candidatus Sulfotelmatobacter sp.]
MLVSPVSFGLPASPEIADQHDVGGKASPQYEQPLAVSGQDFALDLLFFHRGLNCLVAIELKVRRVRALAVDHGKNLPPAELGDQRVGRGRREGMVRQHRMVGEHQDSDESSRLPNG